MDDEPVFKQVFGDAWGRLPLVMHRHYANRAGHDDLTIVEGRLNVRSGRMGRLLKPLFRLTQMLVPYEGENVPCTVRFRTDVGSNAFRFDRELRFPGRKTCHFRSAMIPLGGNEVIEKMGPGICWRMAYSWDGQKVVLAHRGYALSFLGLFIPLPLTWLVGAGYAEEVPISDDAFAMVMEVRHPLWGLVTGYNGTFRVVKDR